jgi:hypothetical protein
MTDFIVSITDPVQLAGITWARQQYNAAIPPPPPDYQPSGIEEEMVNISPQSTVVIDTDEEYVQWVMEQAAISYADQQLKSEYQTAYETDVKTRSGGKNA